MRVGAAGPLGPRTATDWAILDEESPRAVINAIAREELEGELGDRINQQSVEPGGSGREISAILEEQRKA